MKTTKRAVDDGVERGEISRLMITVPPRHGKSMLASEFFPAWYLGRNPSNYVIAATYAQDLFYDRSRNPYLDRHPPLKAGWAPPAD